MMEASPKRCIFIFPTADRPKRLNRKLDVFWYVGSVVGYGTMLQAGRSRVRIPMRSLGILIDLILKAVVWPWGRLSL
jgi:hypothetical protein